MSREQSGVLYLVAAFTLAVLWTRGYLNNVLTALTSSASAQPGQVAFRPLDLSAIRLRGTV
jgi:hypothetical protein